MNKSIEIQGRTILLIGAILAGLSSLIFVLNKYDNDKKMEKLDVILDELDKFKTAEVQSLLLNINPDSLEEAQVEDILKYFSVFDNKGDFRNTYDMQMLLEDGAGFYGLNYRNLQHYGYYQGKGQLFYHKNLSKKEAEIIGYFKEPKADVHAIIKEHFSFLDSGKIIYPIARNKSKNIYLYFTYFESR